MGLATNIITPTKLADKEKRFRNNQKSGYTVDAMRSHPIKGSTHEPNTIANGAKRNGHPKNPTGTSDPP
jgi:hypothetical protein